MKKRFYAITFLIIAALFFSSPASCETKNNMVAQRDRQMVIRLGMLPIIDNLPFWVARERGYFK